jgi:hypothetical protein
MWLLSIVALGVVSVADVHSSVGKYEHNPLLRKGSGEFSAGRGTAAKLGMIGSIAGVEYLMYRKARGIPRSVSFTNFAAAGVIGGTALRNYRISEMRRPTPATPLR